MVHMRIESHICAHCKRSYLTDNSWIHLGEDLEIEAYLCSQTCLQDYLLNKGYKRNGLGNLVAPDHWSLEGNE